MKRIFCQKYFKATFEIFSLQLSKKIPENIPKFNVTIIFFELLNVKILQDRFFQNLTNTICSKYFVITFLLSLRNISNILNIFTFKSIILKTLVCNVSKFCVVVVVVLRVTISTAETINLQLQMKKINRCVNKHKQFH